MKGIILVTYLLTTPVNCFLNNQEKPSRIAREASVAVRGSSNMNRKYFLREEVSC